MGGVGPGRMFGEGITLEETWLRLLGQARVFDQAAGAWSSPSYCDVDGGGGLLTPLKFPHSAQVRFAKITDFFWGGFPHAALTPCPSRKSTWGAESILIQTSDEASNPRRNAISRTGLPAVCAPPCRQTLLCVALGPGLGGFAIACDQAAELTHFAWGPELLP